MLRKLCSNSVTSQCLIWQGLCPSNSLLRFPHLLVPLVNQTHYLSLSASGDKPFDTQNKTIDESDINPEAIKLQKTFNCTIAEAAKVYEFLSTNSDGVDLNQINKTLKWLNRCGATLPVMLINCHIFLCSSRSMKATYKRLSLSEWEHVDHFVPILTISEPKIRSIQMKNRHVIRDRIYLFRKYLSIEPSVISNFCSRHLFVFEIELELLKRKLHMLLDNNVSPENILRDLNVLARAENVIEERLQFIKMHNVQNVMPWMIKCEDHVLIKSLAIRSKRGDEQNNILDLLKKRLHWHGATAISLYNKNPFLQELKYETASKLLDELLRVFSPPEITENISLLSLNLSHVKIRVSELLAVGPSIFPVTTKVLNMCDEKFKQFLDSANK